MLQQNLLSFFLGDCGKGVTREIDTWKYLRRVEYFVDYYSFKESGEMESKLCTDP